MVMDAREASSPLKKPLGGAVVPQHLSCWCPHSGDHTQCLRMGLQGGLNRLQQGVQAGEGAARVQQRTGPREALLRGVQHLLVAHHQPAATVAEPRVLVGAVQGGQLGEELAKVKAGGAQPRPCGLRLRRRQPRRQQRGAAQFMHLGIGGLPRRSLDLVEVHICGGEVRHSLRLPHEAVGLGLLLGAARLGRENKQVGPAPPGVAVAAVRL
mmetsp:Transcript_19766/g.50591  ORF Transcript_19766/g.50591 Transcript_19766/m.50591 type:complete len:211 (+) Transcript_19766:95-727(+)